MSADPKAPDAMHFRSLHLENVRAFGSAQSLNSVDENDAISRWNLILGINGVGKTTLMWALAVMRPVRAADESVVGKSDDAETSQLVEAAFSALENEDIIRFIRRGGTRTMKMNAELVGTETGKALAVGAVITGNTKDLTTVDFPKYPYRLRSGGPFVIGYGAGRHIGHHNLAEVDERSATKSLFADAIDLYDAEDLVEKLDYAAEKDATGEDKRRLEMLKAAVAALLPDNLTAADIEVRGPRDAGRDPDRSGVHVRTPSGVMPLGDLSLGYQAMFAWTVDLAWRLFKEFPKSVNPLSESAIVLIDEVDLHLHPRWQRDIRRRLLEQFPGVQFIATTHNPITAQETLSEGGNVAVVRWTGDEVEILNRPVPEGEWRFDQLLTSELFDFDSDRSQQAEVKLRERLELIRNPNRSAEQEARLRELDEFVESLPTARSPSAQSFEDLMMNLAKDYPSGVPR
ncbi:MAG TPA: AAA family ATPase [Bryobacteraceae bacterium]|jgi:ABC-type branched-subunit amino acid transport system ATPase component